MGGKAEKGDEAIEGRIYRSWYHGNADDAALD